MFIYSDERREKEYMFLVRPCVFVDVGDVGVDDFEFPNLLYIVHCGQIQCVGPVARAVLLRSHALYSQT